MKGNVTSVVLSGAGPKGHCGRLNGSYSDTLPVALIGSDGTTATAHRNMGIFMESYDSGDLGSLQIDGVCEFAVAGGVIAPGVLCTTSAAGKVVEAASGDRAFMRMIGGKSSTGATADGAHCTVEILPTPIDIA
jgi:hypothetical protein